MAFHGWLGFKLAELVNIYAEPRRLALAFPEARTTYADDSLIPDVAVIRWDRLPLTEDGEMGGRYVGWADVAVEIVGALEGSSDLVVHGHVDGVDRRAVQQHGHDAAVGLDLEMLRRHRWVAPSGGGLVRRGRAAMAPGDPCGRR